MTLHYSPESRSKGQRFKLGEAILRSRWPSTIKFLLIILWMRGGDTWCWPSRKRLARELGITPRHVTNLLNALVRAGAIQIERGEGQRLRSNRYRICFRRQLDGEIGFTIAEPNSDAEAGNVFHSEEETDFTTTVKPVSPVTVKPTSPGTIPENVDQTSATNLWTRPIAKEAWTEVVAYLKTLGMAKTQSAARSAEEHGLTPEKVLEAAQYWETNLRDSHGIGALYEWIIQATKVQAVDDERFWPPAQKRLVKQPQRTRAGMPERQYEELLAEIRRLGPVDLRDLAEAVGISFNRIDERGLDILHPDERDRLVLEFSTRCNSAPTVL